MSVSQSLVNMLDPRRILSRSTFSVLPALSNISQPVHSFRPLVVPVPLPAQCSSRNRSADNPPFSPLHSLSAAIYLISIFVSSHLVRSYFGLIVRPFIASQFLDNSLSFFSICIQYKIYSTSQSSTVESWPINYLLFSSRWVL